MPQKICIVTGATRGLGRRLASRLRESGYVVVGLGRSQTGPAGDGVVDDYFSCDLSSNSAIDDFVLWYEQNYGRLDLLVHNAAVQNAYDIVGDGHYCALLNKEMAVNFHAPVSLTARLLPMMLARPSRVVVISSLLHLAAKPGAPGYCASKAALSNWAGNLRCQLGGTGVEVSEVIPGLIKTNMTREASERGEDPELLADWIVRKLNRDRIVLPGARMAWNLAQFAPGFIRQRLQNS